MQGEKNVKVYDVSVTDPSYLVQWEAFAAIQNRICLLRLIMQDFSEDGNSCFMNLLPNLQKRKVAVLENGTWAFTAGKQIE